MAAIDKFIFEMNAVGNAVPEMKKVEQQLGKVNKAMTVSSRQMNTHTVAMRKQTSGIQKMTRNMGMLGLQVQDVAVQASMGTDALRIFSMQGPQILSIFGPLGMIAGALAGVGAGVLMASGGLDRFKGVFDAIRPAFDNFVEKAGALIDAFSPVVSFFNGILAGAFTLVGNVIDFVSDNLAILGTAASVFMAIKLGTFVFGVASDFVKFAKAVSASQILMKLFNMTVRRSPLPLLAIMLGITADRMGLITKAMDELKAKFPEFFDAVADAGGATLDLLKKSYEAIQDAMSSRLPAFGPDDKTASRIDQITSATKRLSDAQLRLQSISQSVESSFENAFMSMLDGATSAKDAFRAMARDIIKELYRIFFVKRITGFISQAMDLYFGGPLVGFSGGIGDGRPAPDIPKRATGGPVYANKPYMVGEAGPELMIPRSSGSIIPNNQLGGGGVVVNQVINISTGVQQTVRAEIRQLMPQIADSAKAAVSDAKRRGGSYGRAFA